MAENKGTISTVKAEDVKLPTEATTASSKKPVKRQRTRTIAELHNVQASKMTNTERVKYIDALRTENADLNGKCDRLKELYEQTSIIRSDLETKFSKTHLDCLARLDFALDVATNAAQSIKLARDQYAVRDQYATITQKGIQR